MALSQCVEAKIYNKSKALILQSLRDIITQEEWEKEKSRKTNTNCMTVKDPLKNVQNKLKEQLMEEKWLNDKKLCAAKINLRKAKKRRQEVAHQLDAICKKKDSHVKCLDRVLKQHQLVFSVHSKVKEALRIQQALHEKANQMKKNVVEKLANAELEMERLGKVLVQICRQLGGQIEFTQHQEFMSKWNKMRNY